eukprot:417057-Pelagomonas_calceolata.AAC.1
MAHGQPEDGHHKIEGDPWSEILPAYISPQKDEVALRQWQHSHKVQPEDQHKRVAGDPGHKDAAGRDVSKKKRA